jgi:hypothetical protein
MNTHCPQCEADLHQRYLGPLRPRCPQCKSFLQHNTHPSEARSLSPEIPILLGAAIAASLGFLFGVSAGAAFVLAWIGAVLGFISYLLSSVSEVPPEWRRWALSQSKAERRAEHRNPPVSE